MKIHHIGTVFAAGIVSLATLFVLESHNRTTPPSVNATATTLSGFEDNSSLLELSLPAPTAEPPLGADIIDDGSSAPADASGPSPENDPGVITAGRSDQKDEASEFLLADEPNTSAVSAFQETFAEAVSEATGDSPSSLNEVATETVASSTTRETSEDGEAISIIEETPTGFWLKEARLNDVFQHLAQLANRQFFHNSDLAGESFIVTGQLMNDDPISQMEELALMYGVTIHEKGNTVYALTNSQLTQLPTEPFRYQLKYLRPSDIDQIKLILQPFLTPGSGIIEFETKTNTLIVMDNERKLDALAKFLTQIDKPKQQIAIETRILRVTSSSQNRVGIDWTTVLGAGIDLSAEVSLNSIFNLPNTTTGTAGQGSDDSVLVLSPLQMTAVLRALNEGGLAQQESSPTLITEDNEEGLISIIDRVPIITSTVSETSSGSNVSEEVRYSIDESDPVGDPSTTREIGVSVAVTPTILPDNTIRMSLRPRSAQIVEFVQSDGGNSYPRVNESTVTTTARVPNGHSLLIGGFYEENTASGQNKVPVLGDLPAVNLLFKSSNKTKDHTSLVFIVTPKLYRPNIPTESDQMAHEIHESHVLPTTHDYPDPTRPGMNYKTNMRNTLDNISNKYPEDATSNILLPSHPYNNPQASPSVKGDTETYGTPAVSVRRSSGNKGFFGKVFGGNKANRN